MDASRREFLDTLMLSTVSGAVALAAFPSALTAALPDGSHSPFTESLTAQGGWDTAWGSRLTGRLKTVFDVPEVESGFPVWRASIWTGQYQSVLGVPVDQMSTALVLRHNGIAMALQPEYWEKYGVAKAFKPTHPLSGEPLSKNPAMLGEADGVGAPYTDFTLDKFIARGGVALACDLALRALVVPLVQAVEKTSPEETYAIARRGLIPGVILQPSGMFAVIRAQEAGAFYFHAT